MSGPAVTIVASGGLPVKQVTSGAPLMTSVASGGIAVTLANDGAPFVLEGYSAGPVPTIVATPSSASIPENAAVGTIITTFSVSNGSGTYTWTLEDGGGSFGSATTLVDIGSNQAELRSASLDYETFPSLSIAVQAANGVDAQVNGVFAVTVTDVAEGGGTTGLIFSNPANSMYLGALV